jgi:hypothetical protein
MLLQWYQNSFFNAEILAFFITKQSKPPNNVDFEAELKTTANSLIMTKTFEAFEAI